MKSGVSKKQIIGAVFFVGIIIVTIFFVTNNNRQNTLPTEIGVVTRDTNDSNTTSPTEDQTNQTANSEDTFAESKGVSQVTPPKNSSTQNRNNYYTNTLASTTTANTQNNTPKPINDSTNNNSVNTPTAEELEALAREEARLQAELERLQGHLFAGQSENTYVWRDHCPDYENPIPTIGGYPVCECTSYVAWKVYEKYGITLSSWGNANIWDSTASRYNYRVDNTPEPYSIGQIKNSNFGHVFWVEQVNSDGSIVTSEYNNNYATYLYSGINRFHDFGSMTIPAEGVVNIKFIHLD